MSRTSHTHWRRQLLRLLPSTRLGRFTLYLVAVDLFLYALHRGLNRVSPPAAEKSGLYGWSVALAAVLVALVTVLLLRWIRYTVMWRLRNRLIVTYVFIGVIPVVLVVGMAFAAGYLFAGQFATFLVTSDLQAEAKGVESANSALAAELATSLRSRPTEARNPGALKTFRIDDPHLSRTEITAWYGGQPVEIHRILPASRPTSIPQWATHDFHGVVIDNGALYLRALEFKDVGGEKLAVISSISLDNRLLAPLATDIGEITIYLSKVLRMGSQADSKSLTINLENEHQPPKTPSAEAPRKDGAPVRVASVESGKLGPPANRLDREVAFAAPYPVLDWATGDSPTIGLLVKTRPSLLYQRLFIRVGEFGLVVEGVLVFIAVSFAIIELLAFLIGLGLTRTITRSVAELYRATQHINRGDLKHRITVKSRDQLAALESSFNSMTESLERLIVEQKEKERLQNELAIAQEVQAQLFPKGSSDLATLEVHGVCRPARTVSGDYYDFLPLGPERLGLAVGDISGKGISAALLMATVHSAVRAYEFGRMPVTAAHLVVAGSEGPTHRFELSSGPADADFSPALVLTSLNRQLYRSTPAEKYATMFLGIYDGASRRLTYSNAGHLPPIVIGRDGSIRRLDTPGLVIGLFDAQGYEESNIQLHPGDILLAFSDGVTEPENEFGEFGEQRLVEIVSENSQLPLARVSELVIKAVDDWIGPNEQPDDVTLVLARAR